MARRGTIVTAVVLAAVATCAAAGDLGWQWASPLPPAVELRRVVWAQGQYVAVGDRGVIVTSTDGKTTGWRLEGPAGSVSFTDFVSTGSELVAVGEESIPKGSTTEVDLVVLASLEGHHWEERARLEHRASWMYDVACNAAGVCVVVDGSTWAATVAAEGSWTVSDEAFESDAYAVASNGSSFVAVGSSDTFLSDDGRTWRVGGTPGWDRPPVRLLIEVQLPRPRGADVAWDGARYLAAAGDLVVSSADGVEWSELLRLRSEQRMVAAFGFSPGATIVSGFNWAHDPWFPEGAVYDGNWLEVSTDSGGSWQETSTLPFWVSLGGGLQGVASGGSEWLGVGLSGDVLLSDDGMGWACPQGGSCRGEEWWFDGAVDGPAGVLAVGGSFWYVPQGLWPPKRNFGDLLVVRRSPDGTWTSGALIYDERLAEGTLVADGSRYVTWAGTSVGTSRDGFSWNFADDVSDIPLYDATWGHGLFVAVGEHGTVATSADGSAWSFGNAGVDEYLHGVVVSESGFVVAGADGSVLRSQDGSHWHALPIAPGDSLLGVAEGAGRIVAIGSDGLLATYSDAEGWVNRVVPTLGAEIWLDGVAWDGTYFAVVGRRSTRIPITRDRYYYELVTLVSRDGVHWTLFPYLGPAAAALDVRRLRATSTGFVGVGANRTLVEATDFGTLLELDPPVGRIPLNQPATLTVAIDQARDEPTEVLLGASSGAIEVPRLVTIPAGATSVGVPIRGIQVETGVEIRAELPDAIGGGIAVSRLSVGAAAPRRPGGRRAAPAGAAGREVRRLDPP